MKNENNSLLKILTYLLIVIIIAFLTIFYLFFSQQRGFNINLSSNSEKSEAPMPSQLKWHDSFKGINNMQEKKAAPKEEKSKPANFLQYEIDKNKNR
jgi:flagellar basal body-associated protein FliL